MSGSDYGRDRVAGGRRHYGCCSVTDARTNGGYSFCAGSESGCGYSYGSNCGWGDPRTHSQQLTRSPERAASSIVRPPGRGLSTS
jgi:hypothetical protein